MFSLGLYAYFPDALNMIVEVYPGVISRGAQGGGAPLLKLLLMLGGLSPPKTLALAWLFRVYWPCFQSAMINCALLYGYQAFLIVNYTISLFN